MHNRTRYLTTRRPRQDELLTKPSVPVADPLDGLIKTEDLIPNVSVTFPIWDDPKINDSYQLQLGDDILGEPEKLTSIPPAGTILTLDIPTDTSLRDDGLYDLIYLVKANPGGGTRPSAVRQLIVDRTPPGAHQLGFMEFPEEAKDGLTAAELSEMGDVLTGKIFGYTGLSKGDVIKTYWGSVDGPEVTLTGDEEEDTPIEVNFEKAFLTSLGNSAGATFYTVTDRAGNVSPDSRKVTIPLFLTDITPDLLPPVIENYDGIINYIDAKESVEVKIPSSLVIIEGDEIVLHWGGESLGPYPVAPEDLEEPFVLLFYVSYETIEKAGNGLRELKYDVIRDGHIVGFSQSLEVVVNVELPVPGGLDKATVRGGSSLPNNEDNFIDVNDYELDATIIINWNDRFQASQIIDIYWGGQEVLQQPYRISNTDVAAGRPLLLTAQNGKFRPVGTGNDIRVYYTVKSPGNPNTSTAPEQGIIVQSRDELPGGPDGPDAPQFTALNENGAINEELAANGAPVYIKPYVNIEAGQTIVFTYEAYDDLVGGEQKFIWTHTSPKLTEIDVVNGYNILVPRERLIRHCYGHAEAFFQVQSDKGQGNSKRASVYVDMRRGNTCNYR
ncbi:hypothetical protein AUC61_10420 [Pseudomonas sp. S25]|uniref:Ig-like domain (Group 3) n=1 Tax=Pseudomonas maioricensis TaxID=1766623 RepID=A0ABS9ZI98_9PSED|nr:hypothetical protein [Pseudomonas sp. S25]MCI8209947.1 hypothetical protein [Pseudomonas sp. S25]